MGNSEPVKIWLKPLPDDKMYFRRKDLMEYLGFHRSIISKYLKLFPELAPRQYMGKGWRFYDRDTFLLWAFVKELKDVRKMGPRAIRIELDRRAKEESESLLAKHAAGETVRTPVERPGPVPEYVY